MNKAFRFVFALFAFVMLIGVFSLTNANAQGGPMREAINRMDAMNKSLVSLKSDVKMDKFNSQLGETDTTSGTTSYLPKTSKHAMYARIDWTSLCRNRSL